MSSRGVVEIISAHVPPVVTSLDLTSSHPIAPARVSFPFVLVPPTPTVVIVVGVLLSNLYFLFCDPQIDLIGRLYDFSSFCCGQITLG